MDKAFGLESSTAFPCSTGRLVLCLITSKTTKTAAKIPRLASVADSTDKLTTRHTGFCAGTGGFILFTSRGRGGSDLFWIESLLLAASDVGGVGPDAGGVAVGGLGSSRANLTSEFAGTRTERSGINGSERETAC
jgi:hypothetical protein